MNASHCREVWAKGGVVRMLLLHLSDPRVCELAAGVGWDALWIDLEHSPRTTRELEGMCRAVRAGASESGMHRPDVMARPGKGEMMRMGRLLEAGAHGILYPRCESVAEAREVVRWMKFAPRGERGFDGGNHDNHYGSYPAGDYVKQANEQTWLAAQIESPSALACAEEIADVDGVDVVFFGPGDFSCLTGHPGEFLHPEVHAAAKRVAQAAHRAGKVFGTIGIGPDHTRAMQDLDCRLLALGADQGLLKQAMISQLKLQ